MNTTHTERLEDEYYALNDKLTKLNSYIATAAFKAMASHERVLMEAQQSVMNTYLKILSDRIKITKD